MFALLHFTVSNEGKKEIYLIQHKAFQLTSLNCTFLRFTEDELSKSSDAIDSLEMTSPSRASSVTSGLLERSKKYIKQHKPKSKASYQHFLFLCQANRGCKEARR